MGNKWVVVANYAPPGNYQGQFSTNVLPLIGAPPPPPPPPPPTGPAPVNFTKFRQD